MTPTPSSLTPPDHADRSADVADGPRSTRFQEWTNELPQASGWWWLEHRPGSREAVRVWSPADLQRYDPEAEWQPDTWYMESGAYMGWIPLDVARGGRWAGGPAKTREALEIVGAPA